MPVLFTVRGRRQLCQLLAEHDENSTLASHGVVLPTIAGNSTLERPY